MKEASRLINFLTTHNISNQEDIENSSTQKYNERMMLVSQLNKKQRQIDEIGDVIKLINTYEKYKAVHTGLQNSKNPSRYKKENITALHKYDDAVDLCQYLGHKKLNFFLSCQSLIFNLLWCLVIKSTMAPLTVVE